MKKVLMVACLGLYVLFLLAVGVSGNSDNDNLLFSQQAVAGENIMLSEEAWEIIDSYWLRVAGDKASDMYTELEQDYGNSCIITHKSYTGVYYYYYVDLTTGWAEVEEYDSVTDILMMGEPVMIDDLR